MKFDFPIFVFLVAVISMLSCVIKIVSIFQMKSKPNTKTKSKQSTNVRLKKITGNNIDVRNKPRQVKVGSVISTEEVMEREDSETDELLAGKGDTDDTLA